MKIIISNYRAIVVVAWRSVNLKIGVAALTDVNEEPNQSGA